MNSATDYPRIPDDEFQRRMTHLRGKMAEQSIDLLVIYSNLLDPGHVRYLSDFSPINESAAMVIPLEGEPILCSGQACQAWAEHKSRVKEIRILPEVGEVSGIEYEIGRQYTFHDLFGEIKGKYSVRKIGTVGTLVFPVIIHQQLLETFPDAQVVNAEPIVYALRVVKSPNEIACMRKAGNILDNAFTKTVEKIEPGWTELDIQAEIEAEVLRNGAESLAASWDPMIPSGPVNTQLCMNRNSRRPVEEGEIIDLQAGAVYEGYNAALCTPLVLGKIPDPIRRAVLVSEEVASRTIEVLKPGATSKQLNDLGRGILKREGFAGNSPYGLIHTIGCLECESPWLPAEEHLEMREGMTICLDIFLFRFPWGSFRWEDTLALRKDGAERLTKFNQTFVRSHFCKT